MKYFCYLRLFSVIMHRLNDKTKKVDNCIGTWRHNTKFTSWINTSHDDKLQCTVYSAI